MTPPKKTTPKKRRAINKGPEQNVAKARQELYKCCLARIKDSIKVGFYLEAIALLESMICDRLESRLAMIHSQAPEKRVFQTIGQLVQELCGKNAGEEPEARSVYADIKEWGDLRNEAIHEFAKLQDGEHLSWKEKSRNAGSAARKGLVLFRKLDRVVTKLNKGSVSKPVASPS